MDDTRHVHVLAHNCQRYDGYFVVHKYHGLTPIIQQLRNGARLLEVLHYSIRTKKGYFPHKFNTPDHQDYVRELFAVDYYMPEAMSLKRREEFEKWHADQWQQEIVFDFPKEFVVYCESDVKLLKEGCVTPLYKRPLPRLAIGIYT